MVTLFDDRRLTASGTALSTGDLLEIDCERSIEYTDRHQESGYELIKPIFEVLVERLGKASERAEYSFALG
jgi:hypothetical protein